MIEIPLQLTVPARVRITDPQTQAAAVVDVEEARQLLARAEGQPTDDERWDMVRDFVAGLFEVPVDLARNQLIEFHNTIVEASNALAEHRKKKIANCVSSLTTSLASQGSS